MESNASGPNPQTPEMLAFAIRRLVRGTAHAALATTLAGRARPYVSLVTVATAVDASPILLLSTLSDHTRNIAADPRIALLCEATAGFANPQEGPRVSLEGQIEPCADANARRRFLARHPGAARYAGFGDFAFFRMRLERAHWVGGFGRARWLEQGLTLRDELAAAFAERELGLLETINTEDPALPSRLAHRILKKRGENWRAVALDPDGIDLENRGSVFRVAYDAPLKGPKDLPKALMTLADEVRSNP